MGENFGFSVHLSGFFRVVSEGSQHPNGSGDPVGGGDGGAQEAMSSDRPSDGGCCLPSNWRAAVRRPSPRSF